MGTSSQVDGIVLRHLGHPERALAVRRGERAIAGNTSDDAIRFEGLAGRRHCAIEVGDDGVTVVSSYAASIQVQSPRVNDQPVEGARRLQPGDRLALVAENGARLELDVEPGGPLSGVGPMAVAARGVVRVAPKIVGVMFEPTGCAGAVSYWMWVHGDGVVLVSCAAPVGEEQPLAAARLEPDALKALALLVEGAQLGRLGERVGEGPATMVVTVPGRVPVSTSFGFQVDPRAGHPAHWRGLVAAAARIAVPLAELMRLVMAAMPRAEVQAWRATLPRLPTPIAVEGLHGRLRVRYGQYNAMDRAPSSDRFLKLWEDGTIEVRVAAGQDDDGSLSDVHVGRLAPAAVERLRHLILHGEMGLELALGPSVFFFQVLDDQGVLRAYGVSYEVDHGVRFGSALSPHAEEAIAELSLLFRERL